MLEVHISITGLAIFVLILIVFLIGLLFYLYPGSGKLTTIPGPVPSDVKYGNVSDLERAGSLHEYLRELHADYGDTVAFRLHKKLIVSVANIQHFSPQSQVFQIPGFLFDHWKVLVGEESFLFCSGLEVFKRRDFLEVKLKANTKELYAKYFLLISQELAMKWKGYPDGDHIPLSQHIRGLSLKAVCFMMFGDYFGDDKNLIKLNKLWEQCWNEAMAVGKNEPTKDDKEIKKATDDLNKIFQNAIEHQWKNHKKSGSISIIDGLLTASNSGLTETQMLSDVITLFAVGTQVAASVLTWSLYFLSANPKPQRKLRQQLEDIHSLDVMPQTLMDNKLIKSVLKESIRCGEAFSYRGITHDMNTSIDEHIVEKETPILEAVSVLMKNEALWPEPCKFDPSRHLKPKDGTPDPLSFLPFSFGSNRKNPEDSLVYMLASITIGSIMKEMSLKPPSGENDYLDPNYESLVSFPSKEEIWVMIGSEKQEEEVGRSEL